MTELTHAEVLRRFHYDPLTGIMTHLVRSSNRVKIGDPVGSPNKAGYLTTTVEGKSYRLHRLAWFYMTGQWPTEDVDHEDNVRSNNAWKNLREGTREQNLHNMRAKGASSGFKGVTQRGGSFLVRLRTKGKVHHIGSFSSGIEAALAYDKAVIRYHGEFAKTNKALGLL